MPGEIALEALDRVAKGLPWNLVDGMGYFVGGVIAIGTGALSILGVAKVDDLITSHLTPALTVMVVLAYPVGFLSYAVGSLAREAFKRIVKPDELRKTTDTSRTERALRRVADAVERLEVGNNDLAAYRNSAAIPGVTRALASKYCPTALASLDRAVTVFHYGVCIIGSLLVLDTLAVIAAGRRYVRPELGPSGPWLLVALLFAVLVPLQEYMTRRQNETVAIRGAELSAAVLVFLSRELKKEA